MAVMVKNLYKNGTFLYNMKLIAGKNGLSNFVQWVHIIEDDSVGSFLHGRELVFTAGILNNRKDWLLDFTKRLYESEVSAFVVNIGPHTKDIPEEVIEFCNQVNMPLFTIPWETRMVDMTRDFCRRIMNNEHIENSMATTIKNIIFKIGDSETQILQMERYGYHRDSRFCFVSIGIVSREDFNFEEKRSEISICAERIARNIRDLFVSFTYKECLVIVLSDYTDEEIEGFVKELLLSIKKVKTEYSISLGISANQEGIYNQEKNFEKAFSALEMAKKRKESFCYYDKLSIYKVLYSVSDKAVLRGFYNDTIYKLEIYDRENHSELTELLKTYLENNGSLQLVSEKLFIHRNTVTNQLKKIEKIVGYDPLNLEDKVMLYMGFYIRDIL